ncbi:MAG: FAD-binding protein [Acidobacteria bacterium]|nr:FAD-binding protein [Acidobacteriota bacterium]
MAERSAGTIDWLTSMGNKWTDPPRVSGAEALPEYTAVTPTKARGHYTTGGGATLFKTLADAATARSISILYETPATELIADTERIVLGVKAVQMGVPVFIHARNGVVVATGGFNDNKELMRAYSPVQGFKAVSKGVPGLTGDGIRMAQALGADVRGMTEIVAAPSVRLPGAPGFRLSTASILVNERGRRFCSETVHYDVVAHAISRNRFVYAIFDEEQKAKGGNTVCSAFSRDLVSEINDGLVVVAPTLAELATTLHLESAAKLEDTVNEWNVCVDVKADPEFGRATGFGYVRMPPFYAVEVTGGMYDTNGGLKINSKTQVLDVSGAPIARLYAASPGSTGGVIGAIYPGSGSAVQVCLCLGRIAGKNAATETALV